MTPAPDPAPEPTPVPAEIMSTGELSVVGRITSASNTTYLCEARRDGHLTHCVYKPISGEAPLWDFPDGTLAGREAAAYLISARLGWNIVPHTVVRDGPAGPGMVQRWVDQPGDVLSAGRDAEADPDEPDTPDLVDLLPPDRIPAGYLPVLRAYDYAGDEVTLVHADDARLRRMAVFDVLINNADRKGGHILAGTDGGVYGVDHGVSLHRENKLRTVLWGWAGTAVDDDTLAEVAELPGALRNGLGEELGDLITPGEVDALHRRTCALLARPVMPEPDRRRPIPWPAF